MESKRVPNLFLFVSAFLNDVRTRYERQDPALLKLLDKVRAVKAMVEEEARREHLPAPEGGERVSRRDGGVSCTSCSPPRTIAPRRTCASSALESAPPCLG